MKHSRNVLVGRLALVSTLVAAGLGGLGAGPAQADAPRDHQVVAQAAPADSRAVVADANAPRTYRFATAVPVDSVLRPAVPSPGNSGLTGNILVAAPTGATIGAFDAAWAQDAMGRPVATSYEISGTSLIQTVVLDAGTAYPVTMNAPLYSAVSASAARGPAAAMGPAATAASGAFVAVPANYVYNPALGSLHDYCTDAPDQFYAPFAANADFRGPCARHDMCYEAHVAGKSACDNGLHADMDTNCDYQYGTFSALRGTCRATADVYWGAVVVAGGY